MEKSNGHAALFSVEYTACTNSCSDYARPVRFYELEDGRTFFATAFKLHAGFEPMVDTRRLR